MNDFSKVYTVDDIKKMSLVTVVTLPMEESIMVPVSQAIDFMKNGENIAFFSLNHDSIKITTFFQQALAKEENPENFGQLAIIDSHQIPKGDSWDYFIDKTIKEIKASCELNVVFLDIYDYVQADMKYTGDAYQISYKMTKKLREISHNQNVSFIFVKTIQLPKWTAQQNTKKAPELPEITIESLSNSIDLVTSSDLILSINGDSTSFWKKLLKKVINFLWFWRKRNNFTLRVLKNRIGSDSQSYRMNINKDTFETEIL